MVVDTIARRRDLSLAIARPIREEIVRRCQQGVPLKTVAEELGLSYRTVRRLWRRYRQQALLGLEPAYARCGRRGLHFDRAMYQATVDLKGKHARWGSGLILLQLGEQFQGQILPSERTISRWLKGAGLQPMRGRRPKTAERRRGGQVHEVWQVDAKEQIVLGDGQGCCQLSVVDEASGAALGAVPFPPGAMEPSAAEVRSSGPAGVVWPLGAAGADPAGSRLSLGLLLGPATCAGPVADRLGDWPDLQ